MALRRLVGPSKSVLFFYTEGNDIFKKMHFINSNESCEKPDAFSGINGILIISVIQVLKMDK